MTTSRTLHITAATDLTGFSADTLGRLWGKYDEQALAAGAQERAERVLGVKVKPGACMRACMRRQRIGEEIARRGLILRRSWDGVYMVGRPADFEPCGQAA